MKFFAIYLLLLLATLHIANAREITIAFYNVENLADTVRNPLTDDSDYTPAGRFRWDTEKYNRKIKNIARVIDDLDADILGICEVENEEVIRDLMYACKTSYNYIHRQTNDRRGMDIALIYKGDTFFPKHIEQYSGKGVFREFLVINGVLYGEEIYLMVCHMPSMGSKMSQRSDAARSLNEFINKLQSEHPGSGIIVMGDFNTTPDSYLSKKLIGIGGIAENYDSIDKNNILLTPFTELSKHGYGNYIYRDKRSVFDFIAVDKNILCSNKLILTEKYGIFVREYLMHTTGNKKGYPVRTFDSGTYLGGYSDHLPVYITLSIPH